MASPACLWKVDGVNVSVALSAAVLGELRAGLDVVGPLGAVEVGGILWGRAGTVGGEPPTCVDTFEPFVIEHRSGALYSLSAADQRQLERKLRLRRRDGLVPVGLWRSHLRRGLYLDQRDFDLFARLFHNPASVFLLVRREEGDAAKGAIFVWEENDVRRHQSYLEFPLEGLPAAAETARIDAPAAPVRKRRPETAASKPEGAAPQKEYRAQILRAAMYLIAIGLPLASFYAGRQAARNQHRDVAIPRVEAPPVPLPDPKPSPLAEPLAPAMPPVSAPPDSRDRSAAIRAAAPPRRIEIQRPASRPAPIPALPDAPAVAQAAPLPSVPRIVNLAPSAPSPRVETVAYIKPAPRSGFRKAIRKIPLLRSIGGSNAAQGFVPANPVAEPLPALPEGEISGSRTSVELVAKIDRDGSVANVKFSNGNSQLTDASASALSRWRFEPARQDGEPVESDMLVRFEFRKRP